MRSRRDPGQAPSTMSSSLSVTSPSGRGRPLRPGEGPFTILLALLLCCSSATGEEPKPPADPKTREIFVPFEDLDILLEGQDQRVLLTRKEYEELISKAELSPVPKVPRSRVVLSADYDGVVEDGRATIQGVLTLELMTDDLIALPLALRGVTLRSATLDGRPAPLGKSPTNVPTLFVKGAGKHELKLEMIAPLQTSAAQQSLNLQLPNPASTRFRLSVPGNVDVKSGAEVISREVDAEANVTRFELLPQRQQATIVMSLNNRILMQQRVILARSVLIDELTQSYEKLHATVFLSIPHGAVDRFRFALPSGFEVTDVTSPLLARWAVEKGDGDARVLDVLLREATRDSVLISIVAVNHTPQMANWTMPQFRPLDVASHVAIVGLLAEDRLTPVSLVPNDLIPIDANTLNTALPASVLQPEPGAPRLRPIAAYYSPQSAFQLQATYRRSDARVEVTSNLLFTISDRQLQLRGGFALRPLVEPLFITEFQVPAGWQVTGVTQNDGAALPFELFVGQNNATRLQVRLPHGAAPGQFFNLFIHAHSSPAGWLNEWSQTNVQLPVFAVSGATRDIGAVAVQTADDLVARPDQLTGLTPLDEKEKANFGLGGTVTSLAYRYESQPYSARLVIERPQPRATARTFGFLRIELEGLFAHYELLFHIDHARARRLTIRLPADTPEALVIRGLDVPVKEFRSEMVDGDRQWVVELAEPRSGKVRLAVDFQQSLPPEIRTASLVSGSSQPTDIPLPMVRAANVTYQSGTFAVEGDMEFDIQVKTDARKVDVGELVDAEYQVGKRLLGAFGYVGEPGVVLATIARRPEFGLPSAIIQRAELVTIVSSQGLTQTAARFQLRTKAPFLEIGLPANSTLWSATVGDQPAAPQRDGDRLLISLSSGGVNELRDLKLVYETPIASWSRWGEISADAPHLLLRDETGKNRAEVPLVDLQWHLVLPDGHRIVRSVGSVFTDATAAPISPAKVAALETSELWEDFSGWNYRSLSETELRKSNVAAKSAPFASGRFDAVKSPQSAEVPPPTAAPEAAREAAPDTAPRVATPPTPTVPELAMPVDESRDAALPGLPSRAGGMGGGGLQRHIIQDGTARTPVPMNQPVNGQVAGGVGGPAQQPEVTGKPGTSETAASKKDPFWALQGVRSLPVELARMGQQITFHSLGDQPRLQVTLANSRTLDFLSALIAILVGFIGLTKSKRPVREKFWFIVLTGAALLAVPLVIGLFTDFELTHLFAPAFYVVCWLVVWYLLFGVLRWIGNRSQGLFHTRRAAAATTVVVLALMSGVQAQEPSTIENLRHLLAPAPPVKVPADAIVIPYNTDDPLGPQNATKVFVPYSEYVKLWNLAFPDKPLTAKTPVTPFAIGGTNYTATLDGDEYLSVIGRMEIEVYAEGSHQILLPLTNAVLTKVTVNGQPARMQVIQATPAAPNPQPAAVPNAPQEANQQAAATPQPPPPPAESIPAVLVEGVGRQQLEFELRFRLTRSGGWRIVSGRVPVSSAAALDLIVPAAKTEIRVGTEAPANAERDAQRQVAEFETQQDSQTIHTAVPADGQLHLQWRPKLAESQVDQSLTARSTAVLDIQEDALRLTWQTDLTFRRGLRDTFTFTVPGDMLLEKVVGGNVRGWKSTVEGDTAKVDVTLLKSAVGTERLTLLLSKRTAVGEGAMAAFAAPAVTVADAALHQGTLVVRRSPMLDVRVDNVNGLSRADANEQETAAVLANVSDDSPLGIRVFQTYRFSATPFTLRIQATPYVANSTVEIQSLLRIAERENHYEARLNFTIDNRPRFAIRCRLPTGLVVDEVTGPASLDWSIATVDQRELLSVFLANGQQQQFSIVIRGRLPRANAEAFPAPTMEVLDVNRQSGQFVVQADPAYEVRAEQLQACENAFLEQVYGWLSESQRSLARIALSHRTGDFSATIRVIAKQPKVRVFSITNSRITPFAVEDTIYVQYAISDAGIREVIFQLPVEMRDARIMVPLLRQKTFEPVPDQPNRIRVKLELQDEVTDSLIVVVEHDRALTGNTFESPIPVLETGTTENRFVVLENVGRDELVVSVAEQMTELNRQQTQWTKLAETLGDSIMQAYVVREDATQPRLAVQTKQRATVETAGARIGLANTLLVVDGHGAYRGTQEYLIDNRTEQYLEIELPEGAQLWTARVASDPVKPVTVSGASPRSVFIPLIKTAAGDRDYSVELKYGGRIRMPGGPSRISFPLMHTKNIRVERSQVRLRLPETRTWLDFGGTMRYVPNTAKMLANYKAYQTNQLERLLGEVQKGESFTKVRAANNLKQLRLSIESSNAAEQQFLSDTDFQREFSNNTAVLQQAKQVEQVLEQQAQAPQQAAAGDNRSLLLFKCASQPLSRAKNVVTQLDANFDSGAVQADQPAGNRPADGRAQQFNLKWLKDNRLEAQNETSREKDSKGRVAFDDTLNSEAKPAGKDDATRAVNDLGKKVAEEAAKATLDTAQAEVTASSGLQLQTRDALRGGELNKQVERYNARIMRQQQQQSVQVPQGVTPEGALFGAQPSQPGQPGGAPGRPDPAFRSGDFAATTPVAVAGLTSLDVAIPERGVEYMFFTPRGEIAIDAWMIESSQLERLLPLVVIGTVLAILWFAQRLIRNWTAPRAA